MVMGRKRKHSESNDVVAPSSDKSPAADCSDRSSSKVTGADTSAQASNDIVCSSLQDQGPASAGAAAVEKVPLQRNAANERERARMRVLSKAFSRLKTSLPWVPADTKLSKLDTLRLASCYIAHLSQLLAEDSDDQQTSSPIPGGGNNNSATISSSTTAAAAAITGTNIHPLNLTWPFTFSSRNSSSMGAISSSSSSSVETSRTAPRTNNNHPTKYPALDKAEASSA